ncbi:ABC transporter permease [Aceticella autotrophica]|uniref:ABC transporter permease n=1 Tax=Aceticella autotrophica TaxID=2755338 RepID=A0A975GAV1_9THEO|nr:ABC transporter permease [Aceticella autotrophica]QSZ27536.1 ABC transporter permease [Aceticella autotrophica]
MKYLIKKMFREFWDLKVQFCSVFLMALLGVLIYTGIEGTWLGMQNEADIWFSKSNLADAWISGTLLTDEDLSKIHDISGIKDLQASTNIQAKLKNNDGNKKDADMQLIYNEKNIISKPTIITGEAYEPDKNGCWIYHDFAKEHGIKVGDVITLTVNGKEKKLTVNGTVFSPEYISYFGSSTSWLPDHKQYGYALISRNTMKDFLAHFYYNQIKITCFKNADMARIKEDIENALGNKYVEFFDHSNWVGISNYMNKIIQIKKLSIMFSIIFLLLTLLTMQTTMKRLVETERTQIGMLKALGFRNRQIYFHYALYGFIISLIGSIIGYILAPYTITPTLLILQKKFNSMPIWRGKNSWISFAVLILIVICCTLSSLLGSRKIIGKMPAETMRDTMPKSGKEIALERITGFWNMLSFKWKWVFRDMSRNKVRTAVSIIGILGSMVLLLASFGMQDSLLHANQYMFGTQYDYYAKAILSPAATQADIEELSSKTHQNRQWVEERSMEIRTAKKQKTGIISILEPGLFLHLQNEQGNIVELPDDKVVVSHKLAEDMEIHKGDFVQFRITGNSNYYTMEVGEVVTAPTAQEIYLSRKAWENTGERFQPTALLLGNNDNLYNIKNLPYVKEVSTLKEQLNDANEILNSMKMIAILLLLSAILLSIIVIYDLGILSFTERKREYATMKVLGFYNKEIRGVLFCENILNLFIGWILGTFMGLYFLKIYVHTITTMTFEYTPFLSVHSFIFASCIIIFCSISVSLLINYKVQKVDMVEALKSVE